MCRGLAECVEWRWMCRARQSRHLGPPRRPPSTERGSNATWGRRRPPAAERGSNSTGGASPPTRCCTRAVSMPRDTTKASLRMGPRRNATRAAQRIGPWRRVPWGRAQFFGVVYTAPPIYQAFHADSNVSKQDTHFFNTFSVVIGLLIVIAIGIFALARVVASETQDKQVLEEAQYLKSVDSHLQPVAKEAVAGADNTALAIKPDAGSAGAAGSASGGPAAPKDGGETFTQVCSACHGAGIAGAPKAGDKAAWGPRIAKGKDVLYDHALKGFQGSAGVMPAKGGRADLSDDLVKAAVDHMVDMAK
jgi:cytochrome c5